VYAYSDSLGEGGNGTGAYYLSSCANEIWLQPRGSLNLTGLIVESYFLKGVFDEYKIKTQMDKREAYKGVLETYTEKEFSPQTRENLQNILDDLVDQLTIDIAQDRQMDKKKVKDLIDQGPYNDQEALNLKLVDHLGHYDELKDHLEKKSGTSAAFVSDRQYMGEVKDSQGKVKIALIFVEGGLMGNIGPVTETEINSPRQLAKNLDKALKDKDIHGVVLRVNSPGGTITAAETLWHEVNKFRKAKKPLVVSMGGTAASAAYQLAAPATKIIANPGTLTGSIGVASGKIILSGLLDHFHVSTSRIKSGENAGMWSVLEEFSPESWQKVQHSLDYIYDDFLTKVAQGRNIDKAQVRQIAQGKIWTGRQALEHRLVDGLGGLTKAIEVTKEELGLSRDASVELITLTPKPAFLESVFELMSLQVAKLFLNQVSEYVPVEPVSLQAPAVQVRG
jgi:protease-4